MSQTFEVLGWNRVRILKLQIKSEEEDQFTLYRGNMLVKVYDTMAKENFLWLARKWHPNAFLTHLFFGIWKAKRTKGQKMCKIWIFIELILKHCQSLLFGERCILSFDYVSSLQNLFCLSSQLAKKIYFFAIKNAINFQPFAKAHIFCSNFAPWHKKPSFFREILFWPKLVFWLISHNIFALHNRAIANLFRQSKTSFNQSNPPICLCLMLTSSYALLRLKMMMTMMQWNVTKRIETCSFHDQSWPAKLAKLMTQFNLQLHMTYAKSINQVGVAQCGNFMIFLSLKFCVKSILENVEVLKMPLLHF